ncbi:MAG: sulfite exporter TauE/SafE family protein [Anaerolineae bacterium]|nr:sulfite exporter TauE/SafE family protein [Anaerolineae bacterium]
MMADTIIQYYNWLSGLFNSAAPSIRGLADTINLPLVSVLLFGLMGTLAPCQLSTNVAALAFLSRDASHPHRVWGQTLAFIAGKVTVYLLVGGAVVALSLQLSQVNETVIPVVVVARRVLGPLLIVVGLFMLGLFKLPLSLGGRFSVWLERKVGQRQGMIHAYLLGVAFSFAFCPTLFWLFFGLTIPVAIASPGGVVFPGVFAVGTAIPVLGLAAVMASGRVNIGQFVKRFKATNVWIQRVVGMVFVLIGIHEIILYLLI